MTCRYSATEWLDVLYTSIRETPGGLADACNFLTNRRNRRITKENLRLRLRGEDENRLSMEMFELLVEWMEEKAQPRCHEALHAFVEQFGLRLVPSEQVEPDNSISGLERQTLRIFEHTGQLATEVRNAAADGVIDPHEAEAIIEKGRLGQRVIELLIESARKFVPTRR
jgi:hypothetical protein